MKKIYQKDCRIQMNYIYLKCVFIYLIILIIWTFLVSLYVTLIVHYYTEWEFS